MIITKNDIKNLRQTMGLSQFLFGRLLGVSEQTIGSWESDHYSPGKRNHAKLVKLMEEHDIRPELYQDEPHFPETRKREKIRIDISQYLRRKNPRGTT